MFRLDKKFWKALEKKYQETPEISPVSKKPLKFSINNLIQSLHDFINNKLQNLDGELYRVLNHRRKNVGYKKDTLYRLFQTNNPRWNPSKELVDLLCFYCYNISYEDAVKKGHVSNNTEQYKFLKSERIDTENKYKTLSDEIENRLLQYYQRGVNLTINYADDFDMSLESFNKHDLEILKKLKPLKESLGEIHWDIIETRLTVNPDIVRGLKIVSPIDNHILGFFIMYPITKNCASKIERGEILKSDDFSLADICKSFKQCHAIYISLVYAIDLWPKAFVLFKLKEELRLIITKFPNIKTLYVRPVSDDGLRNINRQKFVQMKNSPTLYTLQTKDLLSRL